MTRTHEIKLDGYGAHTTLADDRPVMLLGTAESYGIEMLHIAPGKDWEGLTITATFNAADGTSTDMLMGTDGNIAVPTEATAKSGSGRIVFTGVSDGIQRISCDLDYFVVAHSAINGTQSGGIAPSWFEQAARRFMPLGGSTGQVLTKKTDADFDAEWQDSKGGEGGITPTIGDNGNWFLGDTDTGKPSRGDNGKSAYSYAQDGGYTGTEAEFAAKLAAEKLPNPYPLTFTGAVNETYDGSSAKTITIPSGGGGAHSDWNQNDSTAADYIKNRPFYTGDPVETVLVEESTVPFTDTNRGFYAAQIQSNFAPTVGETYKVSWDGTVYECNCVDFSGNLFIGNLSIAGAGSDTGEPFLMGVNDRGAGIYTLDTSASHTFSISGSIAEVVKIDEKYLPEDLATKSDVEAARTTANNAQTTANNAQTTANNAQTTANKAQTTANNAKSEALDLAARMFGHTSVVDNAFSNYINLTLTSLPSGLTSIGNGAFFNCPKLVLTSLPSGLTSIGASAFANCKKIAITSLPSGLTSIDSEAFATCTGLTSITFTGKPTHIANNVFYACTNLTTINVPWAEGEVANAPWGATNATINYNYTEA